jgi:hypothetical protein
VRTRPLTRSRPSIAGGFARMADSGAKVKSGRFATA